VKEQSRPAGMFHKGQKNRLHQFSRCDRFKKKKKKKLQRGQVSSGSAFDLNSNIWADIAETGEGGEKNKTNMAYPDADKETSDQYSDACDTQAHADSRHME